MTTAIYNRKTHIAAADTQNTTASGAISRVSKLERLSDGRLFIGSGHLFTISQVKMWAESDWDEESPPDWEYYLDDPADRGFECLVISPDGERIWRIDEELTPFEVFDDFVAIGSGGAYALGALYAGAEEGEAIRIAALNDPSTSAPVSVLKLGEI